jgi:hypothetical protein
MTKRSDIQKKAEAKIAKILADVPSTTGKSETIFTPALSKVRRRLGFEEAFLTWAGRRSPDVLSRS